MKIIFLIIFTLAIVVPVFTARAQDYILGEGDLLRIKVYENEDLNTLARVSGDGAISMPLVGEVKVLGLTPKETESLLVRLLDKFIVNPQVSVFIEEHKSRRVTILGEVKKPGTYKLNGSFTLLELISWAEGLTENAGDTVIIQRRKSNSKEAEKTEYIRVNLKDVMERGKGCNFCIQEQDKVYVEKGGVLYVSGAVKKPGSYKMSKGLTVSKAIALAEGYADNASEGKVKLTRKKEGEEKTFKVDGDYLVEPDDLITVPESFF